MSIACAMDPALRRVVDRRALTLAVAAYTTAHLKSCKRSGKAPFGAGWIEARCTALIDGSGWATNAADRAALAVWERSE